MKNKCVDADRRVAIIPARGGSKGVPRKNARCLGGYPLIYWQIRACKESKLFDMIIVTSDDDAILAIAHECGAIQHKRSQETSSDSATTESAVLEVLRFFDSTIKRQDVIFIVQATSPLTTCEDYKAAFEAYSCSGANSLVSVTRKHEFLWKKNQNGFYTPKNYDFTSRPRRQEWNGELVENGAFYISRAGPLRETNCRLNGNILAFEMPPERSHDIDTATDFLICDAIIAAAQTELSDQSR